MDPETPEAVARYYIETVGAHDLAPLASLFADDLTAAFCGMTLSKDEWVASLDRLLPALVRNDIREIYSAGDRACVVYDFVTDTPAAAVVCVELVTVRDRRITEIELILDRVGFAPVQAALQERSAGRTTAETADSTS